MNLNKIRHDISARLADLDAGVYSVPETEQFLWGIIAVLTCSENHEAIMLVANILDAMNDMLARQGRAA